MIDMDADKRNELLELVAPFGRVIALIEKQIAPLKEAISVIEERRDAILEKFGIDVPYDELEQCEGCSAMILPTDKVHRCSDGPVLCEDCAPTWNDMKGQLEERISDLRANPDAADEDGDSEESLAIAMQSCVAHIEAGDGDKKHVW